MAGMAGRPNRSSRHVEFVVVEWKGVAGVGGGEPLAAEEAGSIVEQVVGVRW